MTQDEVIEMARQVGLVIDGNQSGFDDLEAFAKLVAAKATAKEREACATLCDDDMVQARYFFYCLVASILQTKLRPEESKIKELNT